LNNGSIGDVTTGNHTMISVSIVATCRRIQMSQSMRSRIVALTVSFAALAGFGIMTPVQAADEPKPSITLTVKDSKLGPIITDDKGLTIYMYTPDAPNVSVCEGGCLAAWPPLMLKTGETLANVKLEGDLRRSLLGVAMRVDGSRHVTYAGWPLYYWIRDKAAGDVTGQWVGSVWFVLSPAGHPMSTRIPAA
jgi:predicted lipoprotein with Yx(FWY)xxD motif